MSVSREELYEQVWARAMTTVAKDHQVSSSFLARVCRRLNVPHPGRGHWARVEAGQAVKQPPLPPASPGDEIEWSRHGRAKCEPLPPLEVPKQKPSSQPQTPKRSHALVVGVREDFRSVYPAWSDEYPRPRKRKLVDLVASAEGVEAGLRAAGKLFAALEARGYRVAFARGQGFSRPELKLQWAFGYHPYAWHPEYPTVTYIGAVAIGLTLYERSEVREYHEVDGKRVALSEAQARTLEARYGRWRVSKAAFPTGRFVVRAYSPYSRTEWTKEWEEPKPRAMTSLAEEIADHLFQSAPRIVELVKAAEVRAEAERRAWEEQTRRWDEQREAERRREEAARQAKALADSRNQLAAIIDSWSAARNAEAFFEEALRRAEQMPGDEKTTLLERVSLARDLLGGTDPLRHFQVWKTASER